MNLDKKSRRQFNKEAPSEEKVPTVPHLRTHWPNLCNHQKQGVLRTALPLLHLSPCKMRRCNETVIAVSNTTRDPGLLLCVLALVPQSNRSAHITFRRAQATDPPF